MVAAYLEGMGFVGSENVRAHYEMAVSRFDGMEVRNAS
jgi:hypothetical protein